MKIDLTYDQTHEITQMELLDSIQDIRVVYDNPKEMLLHAVAMAKYYHPVSQWGMIEELAYGDR